MQVNGEKLFEVLDQQISLYESILSLAKKKKDVIVEGKVAELDNFIKMEQALVMRVGKLEQQREKIATEIAQSIGINNESFTMTEIAESLDHYQQNKFKQYQQNFSKILEELKGANQLNSKLIEQSLEYIEFSINVMAGSQAQSNEYENKGNTLKKQSTNRLFDVKL